MIYLEYMEPLSARKQALLQGILREYIETARPVASQWLVDKLNLPISSATIRNEMKELEEQGYITHPHTSAGRIPTEAGYRYFIEHFLDTAAELTEVDKDTLTATATSQSNAEGDPILKRVAKQVAALSHETVLLTFNRHTFYYTGVSHLFHKPEFQDIDEAMVLSELVDHFDEVMATLHQRDIAAIEIFLGQQNPVSTYCATLVTRYYVADTDGVMAILGPQRMNYQYNYQLLKHVRNLFTQP